LRADLRGWLDFLSVQWTYGLWLEPVQSWVLTVQHQTRSGQRHWWCFRSGDGNPARRRTQPRNRRIGDVSFGRAGAVGCTGNYAGAWEHSRAVRSS